MAAAREIKVENNGLGSITISKTESGDIIMTDPAKGPMHTSLGDRLQASMANREIDIPKLKQKMARSRSLALLSKTKSRKRPTTLSTSDLWQGIHHTRDVAPSYSKKEHLLRIYNREGTPFITEKKILEPSFAPIKDKFVEKYIPLLEQNERREHMEQLAIRSRDYLLKIKQ